ncbi:MAG: mechanosensitive ion channel family protein [Candidatus Woesearchaeota archaeon]
MSYFVKLGESIVLPLTALLESFLNLFPGLLGGILILIFGYLLGEVIEIMIIKGLEKAKFNKFIHNLKISKELEKFDLSHFIGVLVKWYIFIIFLLPAARLMQLTTLTPLLMDFARWAPLFLLAVLIVVFGWIGADVLGSRIESTKLKYKHAISVTVRAFVILMILVIALDQIGINLSIIEQTYLILLSAAAFGTALALGLGFGLALKEDAKKTIKEIKKKL